MSDAEEAAITGGTIPGAPVAASEVPDQRSLARIAILQDPVLLTLLRLAWPTSAVLLAQTAVNIAEAYYIGFLAACRSELADRHRRRLIERYEACFGRS
jgi:hypothetical protein